MKMGIENLKKVFAALAGLANVGDAFSHASGLEKWSQLIGLVQVVTNIQGIDAKLVLEELKDLNATEREELMKSFEGVFDIKDEKLEAKIEEGIDLLLDLMASIQKTVSFAKSFKSGDEAEAAPAAVAAYDSTSTPTV